jgi:hypothetical protein
MPVSQAKKSGGLQFNSERNEATIISTDGYFAFNNIDLTGIKSIEINVSDFEKAAGAEIEVRADSPTGILLGRSTELTSPEKARKETKTKIDLTSTQGQRDLYVVFKNEKGGNQRLIRVTGVAFRNSVL